jgi:DNA-binding IclR family transcriptional regulator
MMPAAIDPNKAKTARRVIEVLEFFDEERRHATVMDIARRYNRPQSSTSELLSILVDMGLLYKEPASRSYMPTPRAAMLGSLFQPNAVRDGRLSMLTDRLVSQTGLATAVLGMVCLNAQVYRWMAGTTALPAAITGEGVSGGAQTPLSDSAGGWLLLSTLAADRREGVLRRLRAEAPPERRFSPADILGRVQECGQRGYAIGPAGFETTSEMCAVLLPREAGERPMVLGLVYEPREDVDAKALVALLQGSVQGLGQPNNSVTLRTTQAGASDQVPSAA